MSNRKTQEIRTEKDLAKIEEAVIVSEGFIMKYRNQLLIAAAVALAIVGIYFAYQYLVVEPRNKQAGAALFRGEQYYLAGQDSLALYGDGNAYLGFLAVADEYGSTDAGNLAKAYAGLSFYRLGDYTEALKYLKSYSGSDQMFATGVLAVIGDCLANTGDIAGAAAAYEKAAKKADNILQSPIFYKKAAEAYRELKNYDKVIEVFVYVKNNYMGTPEAGEADKYITEANMLKGK